MIYFVTIAGQEVQVEVDGEVVRLNGVETAAHLSAVAGTPLQHLLWGRESLAIAMSSHQAGKWELQLEGERYAVEVLDERTRHIQSLTGAAPGRSGPAQLRAPMPGLVVRILVARGQIVEAGQSLLVLEAMKMENELRATNAGVVQSIEVTPGQVVEKGQPLIQLADT